MRKICIFTSTRADWGLLKGVAKLIADSSELDLQLLVSGSHLSEKYGMTIDEIESDGYHVNAEVDILLFEDSAKGICKSMGVALSRYCDILGELQPDVLVVLGDRYETFCAVATAQILRIPVAHIHGGEITEGAVDEAFRHSITKMAHIHFPSCEEYRRRIIQLGEDPAHVFNVGALGLENIRNLSFMSRDDLQKSIGFELDQPFFLVTFHPVTLENATAGAQFDELLGALEHFPSHKVIFTKANADPDGQIINEKITAYSLAHPVRCLAVDSLGARRYLSAMKLCDAVVGNSSSGILETPAFGIPTVNIGDRQKGRMRLMSIIDCVPERNAIVNAIKQAFDSEFRKSIQSVVHPCDRPDTAKNIINILGTISLDVILKKKFNDLKGLV